MRAMTPTRQLLNLKLGSLDAFVSERRQQGTSWEWIARDIYAATDLAISGEALRRWYGTKP